MPLTYEQLAPALYKQATAIQGKLPWFQVHELINACWVKGNVQKLKNIKFAMKRGRYDMFDYIRGETGSRNRQRATRKADALRNKGNSEHVLQNHDQPNIGITSLEDSIYNNKNHQCEQNLRKDMIPGKPDTEPERIDTKDLFEKLCKGLDRQDALLLKLFFLKGFNQREASEVIGHSESRISQMLANLLPRIRVILENLQLTENVNNRREGQRAYFKRDARDVADLQHEAYLRRRKRYQDNKTRKKHALAV